jgi:AbrB family transcriptional regulator (stage V sporulation protein T)
MKATGIVRRIDDLGRVVIPKEIRRTMRIREGDPLEIFTDKDGEIILKKYSPIGELSTFAKQYAETLAQTTGHIICISDKDQVIAVSGGSKKELLEKPISKDLEAAINDRETIIASSDEKKFINILNDSDDKEYSCEVITPIISEGDAIGAVVFLSKEEKQKMGEVETKLAHSAAGFLGKQMEQ